MRLEEHYANRIVRGPAVYLAVGHEIKNRSDAIPGGQARKEKGKEAAQLVNVFYYCPRFLPAPPLMVLFSVAAEARIGG